MQSMRGGLADCHPVPGCCSACRLWRYRAHRVVPAVQLARRVGKAYAGYALTVSCKVALSRTLPTHPGSTGVHNRYHSISMIEFSGRGGVSPEPSSSSIMGICFCVAAPALARLGEKVKGPPAWGSPWRGSRIYIIQQLTNYK